MKKIISITITIMTIFTCCFCVLFANYNIKTHNKESQSEITYSINSFTEKNSKNENKIIFNFNVVDDQTTPDNKPDIVINKSITDDNKQTILIIIGIFVLIVLILVLTFCIF